MLSAPQVQVASGEGPAWEDVKGVQAHGGKKKGVRAELASGGGSTGAQADTLLPSPTFTPVVTGRVYNIAFNGWQLGRVEPPTLLI